MPPSLQLKKAHTINGYPALPFIYNRWPVCYGISGRNGVEWVAGLLWNQWPEWSRMGGQNGVEYAITASLSIMFVNNLMSAEH